MVTPSDELRGQCERLYDAKAAQMILYGRALGLSRHEAEDVLHETFLAVLKLDRVPENLEHYCLRAFRNRSMNFHRGFLRRIARELESRHWFETRDTDSREAIAMRRLAGLPPEQREVIVLKIWHEYTYEEIGALLEVSPNTVAARFRYGMQKLRDELNTLAYENARDTGESTSTMDSPPTIGPAPRQDFWPACG